MAHKSLALGKVSCSLLYQQKQFSDFRVGSVFVKGEIRFTVTDDLQVIPPIASTNSVFTKLGVMDVDATEELTVNIGTVEMFNLLMSSLVSKTPLTETLLKPKQEPKLNSSKVINQAIHIETQMFGDSTNDEEGTISVKLVVSKSKKMDGSLRGCISHLYKTIQDLDGQYMISNHHNDMILDPKLAPGTAMFVVTDNLVVRPISRILELHVLKDLNVPVTDVEDQIVHVGKKELEASQRRELCIFAVWIDQLARAGAYLVAPKGIENQSVQELEKYAVYKAEETTQSVNNCLRIAENIREDATKTLDMLHAQGEQITRTHMAAVDIDKDLSRGCM
ncbi:uncharacterized protein Pyn_30532 [Prunus yedoensis var. nudiflora]|uniref:Uncharacterized protein n=1 Tax=Prunus yedoensis var. nudiflora TaxID=2094558 RepID=A0A314XHW8_PRUYE|nr:uncharacterized protein Pyn_30532 [Prunus yedoensis var. nudiflora]